jgi:hypothetical protein
LDYFLLEGRAIEAGGIVIRSIDEGSVMGSGKFITLFAFLLFSHSLLAQTLNLECDLEGSDLRYQGGKLLKEESCDGVKEKCKVKYYVSIIGSNKFIFANAKFDSDNGVIDPSRDRKPAYAGDSGSSSIAEWKGNSFLAYNRYTRQSEANQDWAAYESMTHDEWLINRMTGSVTRKKYSTISPTIPKLFTYDLVMSGTCKAFTPKF